MFAFDPTSNPRHPGALPPGMIVSLFLRRLDLLAQERPEAIALRFRYQGDWRFWRWRDLREQVREADHGLRDIGFSASDVLWIDGDLGPHLLVVALAVWSLGGTVQPLPSALTAAGNRASVSAEYRYVFLQGRRALTRWRPLLDTSGQAAAGLTLICDRLVPGDHMADGPGVSAPRLLSYAALLGVRDIKLTVGARQPADLYWLEESGNDLSRLPALVGFWLGARVALTFPERRAGAATMPSHSRRQSASSRPAAPVVR